MTIYARLILLPFLLVAPFITHANSTDLGQVLDRLVENYGGVENLRRLDNMIQEWDMVAFMGNRHGTDTRSLSVPGRLRVELDYGNKSEIRLLDNKTGYYVFSGMPPVVVNGMQLDAMQLQLMRLYSPLVLRNKINSLMLIEKDDLLVLSLAERGVQVHYLINTNTWRIEKVAGVLTMNGREVQFLTEYSDFKVIDGVLMHQKENKFTNDINTAILQLRQIRLDTRLNSNLFKP